MSQWPFIPYAEDYDDTETKVTYFKNDGAMHSHLVASTVPGMNSFIIDMFECIQKRAMYTWDVHVECLETPLDWQMTIDKRHVFNSADFLRGGRLSGRKLSHYAAVFETAHTIDFKPRVLVENEANMQELGLSNYTKYIKCILHNQPQLQQRKTLHHEELHRHRQRLRESMKKFMAPLEYTRSMALWQPSLPFEMHTTAFDDTGELVTYLRKGNTAPEAAVYILFSQANVHARMYNCHPSAQNTDWEIVINGRYRMRDIDFESAEPGQLAIAFQDYPNVFTLPLTIVKRPQFIVRHARAMARFQCTNYNIFQQYLHNVDKMKEFVFFEYNGEVRIRDAFETIFNALVAEHKV